MGNGAQVYHQRVELALAQGLQLQVIGGTLQANLHAAGVVAGVAQQGQVQQRRRGGPQAQAHMPGVAAHMVLHHLVQLVGLRHHLAGVLQHGAANGREAVAVALALDQGHAELGFQLGNAAAEGRLRAPGAVGPAREGAAFGQGNEVAQLGNGGGHYRENR